MKPVAIALGMMLGFGMTAMDARAVSSEPTESATDAAKPQPAAEPVAKEEKPLAPPPGFRMKQRGKHLLYCKKEAPMGTRLKSETCFDERQMRDYLLALDAGKAELDRARAVCSSGCSCGQPC
jgi:hypothetical protein